VAQNTSPLNNEHQRPKNQGMWQGRTPTQILSHLLALLVLQGSFTPVARAQWNPPSGSNIQGTPLREKASEQLRNKLNAFMAEIAHLQAVENPQEVVPTLDKSEANLFGLREQSLTIPTSRGVEVFRLGDSLLPLPTPSVSDVLVQTEMQIENGDLLIRHLSRKIVQRISGFNFVSLKHDGQFLFLLTKDGGVFAVSNRFIKKFLFQGPLPVFKVGVVGSFSANFSPENAQLDVVREGHGPVRLNPELESRLSLSAGQKIAFTKGDLFIEVDNTTIEVVDRESALDAYLASAKYLALLTYQNNPRFFETDRDLRQLLDQDTELLQEIQAMLEDPEVQMAIESESSFSVLSSLSPYALRELIPYLQQVRESLRTGSQRKRILLDQFIQDVEARARQAEVVADKEGVEAQGSGIVEQPSNNLSKKARFKALMNRLNQLGAKLKDKYARFMDASLAKIEATMTKSTLTNLAVTLGVMAGILGVDRLTGGHVAAWALNFAAKFWNSWLGPWTDPVVGPATAKAVGILMLTPFLYEATGRLGGLILGKNYRDVLNSFSFKPFGAMAAYLQVFTLMINQKNLMPALRRGVNPLMFRESFNSPFSSDETIAKSRQTLEEKQIYQLRLDSAAWLIAQAVVLESTELDPIAIAMAEITLAENRAQADGLLAKKAARAQSLAETKEMATLAMGIKKTLKDLNKTDLIKGLKSVPPEKLANILFSAYELRDKMRESSGFANSLRRLSQKTQLFWQRSVPRGVGIFGFESYQELLYAEPNDALMRQNLRVFKNAFTGEILLSSVIGSYADMSKPTELLADPSGPLGINQGFFAQQMQSVLFLMLANPAKMYLDFALVRDPSTQHPTADQLLHPRTEREGRFLETGAHYAKNLVNLVKLNMGYYAVRHLKKTFMMIFPAMTIALAVRYGVLDQGIDQAVVGELFRMISSYFAYGWLWGLETRSLTLLEHEVEARAETMMEAQYRINQGLIENNQPMIEEGITRLLKVYEEAGKASGVPENWSSLPEEEIQALAREFLAKDLNDAVVPYHPNDIFMRMVTFSTVVLGSEISSAFFKMAYSSGQPLSQMLDVLLVGGSKAGMAYAGLWALQSALNKASAWRSEYKQIRQEEAARKQVEVKTQRPGLNGCERVLRQK
jgi:hypothetical protein